MKVKSIFFQIILILLVGTITINLIYNQIVDKRIKYEVDRRVKVEASMILKSMELSVSSMLENEEYHIIQRLLDNIGAYPLVDRIRLYDPKGIVLGSNLHEEIGRMNEMECVQEVIQEKSVKEIYQCEEEHRIFVTTPVHGKTYNVERASDIIGILLISVNLDYEEELARNVQNDLQKALNATSIFYLSLFSFTLFVLVARPLKVLSEASLEIGRRNYSHRIKNTGRYEFKILADTFNKMAMDTQQYVDELKEAKLKAEEAAETKIQFLANMSHEIRTPLNSVLGFTDILEENEMDEEKKTLFKFIKKSGSHLLNLVNEILEFSKIETTEIKIEQLHFSIHDIVLELNKMFLPNVKGKQLEFRSEVQKHVPKSLFGDPFRIRQILINLIGNAIKFTKEGEILLEVDYRSDHLILRISDTGIGIPSEKIASIFDPFTQSNMAVSREYGGVGLGLAICKRLVEAMDGSIFVESQEGKGTDFVLRIPLLPLHHEEESAEEMVTRWLTYDTEVSDIVLGVVRELPLRIKRMNKALENHDIERIEKESHALKGLVGNLHMQEVYDVVGNLNELSKDVSQFDFESAKSCLSEIEAIYKSVPAKYIKMKTGFEQIYSTSKGEFRILLAEDVEENRILVSKILNRYDLVIDYAVNGLEAIQKIEENEYDVLLLDIQMPIVDGEEVIKWLRQKREDKKLYVIAITAHARDEDMEKYIAMGCNWYIPKPIDKRLLRSKITELMEFKQD